MHRNGGSECQRRGFAYPAVSQKVRAKSASSSVCNLRTSDIPDAFRQDTLVTLFAKGQRDVAALQRARRELGVSHYAHAAGKKPTVVVLGNTSVRLSGDEVISLAEDIVTRVRKDDLSKTLVQTTEQDAAVLQQRLAQRNAVSVKLRRSASLLSMSHLSRSPSIRGRVGRRQSAPDVSALLFPFVVRQLEKALARARARLVIKHREMDLEAAVFHNVTTLQRTAFRRWKKLHRAKLIGSRASLNRIVRAWKRIAVLRSTMRRAFYGQLMRSIDAHRVHRLLCTWYAYRISAAALRQSLDPYTVLMTHPAAKSLRQRRPDIVFPAIDAALSTQVKTERLTAAIVHQQSKSLRLPWDAWRAYVFARRVKHNNYHMLRIYRAGTAARRDMTGCFQKWRFRMNASRSLSVYLFRLQSRMLVQWRLRTDLIVQDEHKIRTLAATKSMLIRRSCLLHWQRKTKEQTILGLYGTCNVLRRGAMLLPYAYTFAERMCDPHMQWAESRASAALCCRCFRQWKQCWQRGKQFRTILRQQHRLYCYLLMRRAMLVWRSADAEWSDITMASQLGTTSDAAQGSEREHHANGVTGSKQGGDVPPLVRLFGPAADSLPVPWLGLRAVERHCRRSYASSGSLQSSNAFAPRNFIACDVSLLGVLSDRREWIADRQLDALQGVDRRKRSEQPSVNAVQRISFCGFESDGPLPVHGGGTSATGFFGFFLRRALQGLFLFGRVLIASRHASQRLHDFRELIFSKHVILSRERIANLQDAINNLPISASQPSQSTRSQRLEGGKLAEGVSFQYGPRERADNTCRYINACIEQRSYAFLDVPLSTENETIVAQFADVLQEHRESLLNKHKMRVILEAPSEVLIALAHLGFPSIDRTHVEDHLGAIASFLNALISHNVTLRVSFRMRRAYVLKRWAVVDASRMFWGTAGMPSCANGAPTVPRPPRASSARRSRSRSLQPNATLGTGSNRLKSTDRRTTTAPLSIRKRSLGSEHLALAFAIRLRICHALRHVPEHFTAATVFCLVPPKTVVQTIARSQNAPDKLLARRASSSSIVNE